MRLGGDVLVLDIEINIVRPGGGRERRQRVEHRYIGRFAKCLEGTIDSLDVELQVGKAFGDPLLVTAVG